MGEIRLQSAEASLPPLTPRGAEKVVDALRYRYGLGQAYRMRVRGDGRGRWEVTDGLGKRHLVSPMNGWQLRGWFWDRYGDVVAERQQTSEG